MSGWLLTSQQDIVLMALTFPLSIKIFNIVWSEILLECTFYKTILWFPAAISRKDCFHELLLHHFGLNFLFVHSRIKEIPPRLARIFRSIFYKLKCKWGLLHSEWNRSLTPLRLTEGSVTTGAGIVWIVMWCPLFRVSVNPDWRAFDIWGGGNNLYITLSSMPA